MMLLLNVFRDNCDVDYVILMSLVSNLQRYRDVCSVKEEFGCRLL